LKPCLNQDTLRTTPTEKFLEISRHSGYDAVELTMDRIEAILDKEDLPQTRTLISKQGLTIASINGPENFNLLDDRAFTEILDRTGKVVEAAREFGCELLIPVPSPILEGMTEEAVVAQTSAALSRMADCYGNGIKLGLEFLGMSSCSINNLQAAMETIRRVGKRNVGLVLDSFHMYLSNSRFSDINQLKAEQVFLVHVNDSEKGDKRKLTDVNRLYPGEGDIDLKAFASVLTNIGYNSYLSLELLRPAYWEQNPEEVAVKGRESLNHVFGI
jgi:2-keto-myo-inositol isomerase